jgi:putative ABC transport system permease protein
MNTLLHDLRYGARLLFKKPTFTVVAIITLALGIGANTAIFSVVYGVLLQPLPYKEPERLTLLWTRLEKIGLEQNWVSEPEVLDLREQSQLFEEFAVFAPESLSLTGNGEPEQLVGGTISSNLFKVLGVGPAMGRDFAPEEEKPGSGDVAILSHGLWQRRYGADPAIVGNTIQLAGRPHNVVGIMPPQFSLMLPAEAHAPTNIDVWTPYAVDYTQQDRHSHSLTVLGQLKSGVSIEQAQAEMNAIASHLYPIHYTDTGFELKVVSLHGDIVKQIKPALLVLLGAVSFVLLIACANVANLLLARAATREKEIAVRSALGAGRLRIVRQLITESILLSLTGAGFGVVLALWGTEALLALAPANLPRVDEVSLNGWVLTFAFGIALLTGIIFGLVPALQVSKPNLASALKEGGRTGSGTPASRRLRNLIVAAEIALSLVLLVGAGLMAKSFLHLQKVDAGFDPNNVLTMKLTLPRSKYADSPKRGVFYRQAVERINTLPGVTSVSAISQLPLSNDYWSGTYTFYDAAANAERDNMASFEADTRIITNDYFKTMRTPLLSGRFFNDQDESGRPFVAIIDERLAQRLWPGESALNKKGTFGKFPEKPEAFFEVVGVVKHIRHHRLSADVREQVYFPHAQRRVPWMTLAVRSETDPMSLVGPVRSIIQSLDQDQPVYQIRTMEELFATALAPTRFTLLLVLIFAIVAIALAGIGIYGVMSYSSAQRTQEIGIRMALGAQPRDILRLVMSQGIVVVSVGVVLGLVASFAVTRVMTGLLYEVSATDPPTFGAVSLLLMGIAVLACYLPTRRATKVDPLVALRYE